MKISFSKQTKERAFKQLYEEYYAPFCLYAKRFVDDKETREDIVSDVFTSLWDKLDTDELYRMLYETLNKLPENYRTVFIKSFFEGKTHTEIAEEMNLSVKSINRYKQKTMELLRNELKDYMPLLLLLFLRA